jgi:hypothetical protein
MKTEQEKPATASPLEPAVICKVNGKGDIACDGDNKRFVGKECKFIKITKSGLYHVSLLDDKKATASLPKRNIDFYT